ncbi:MAG TPA: hypothetical protein VFY40_28695 [Blastocatellia bacterium]|nr:hypothetical protein [Blastocatellia bacterium]
MRDFFRTPINLLVFGLKRHAIISLFLADSDLNSLGALPRDKLQEVAQFWVALSTFRSASCKDFAGAFPAFDFPDSHFRNPILLLRLIRESGRRFWPRGGERSDNYSSPESSARHRQIKQFDLQLKRIIPEAILCLQHDFC